MTKSRSAAVVRRSRLRPPLRFAVIGAGGMGQGYCQVLGQLEHARLAAVCDVNRPAAEEAGRRYGVPAFGAHADLIAARLCDVAVVATPHPFHAPAAVACMDAGLHVLSEKPLSERVSTADAMAAAARRNGVVLAVMFQRRFEPEVRKAMALIRGGQLGELMRATLVALEYRSQRYYDSGTWRATWRGEGGGVMMNQAPHLMDLFVQFCGLPSAVYGRTATRMHRIEVEDQAEALLRFANGAVGYLFCSTCETGPGQLIELVGDRGKLSFRDGQLAFQQYQPPLRAHLAGCADMWGKPDILPVPLNMPHEQPSCADFEAPLLHLGAQPSGHARVLANLVGHLLFGEPLLVPGESGIGSLELANAVTLSSHEDRWVRLPISRPRYDALLRRLQRESRFVKRHVRVERTTDPGLART